MKNIFYLLLFPSVLFSQVNFSEDISPIIYNNCTECHRPGQSGPMSFTNYEEVASLGFMIEYVTSIGYMPPWHADPEYSTFLGERGLSEEEKQLISDWVTEGMLQGDPSLEAVIPEFPEGSLIGTPDAVFTMEEEYLVEGNNQDDYRVFVFSTNFSEDKYLKSIEIVPGNLSAVHHVLVNIDTEGACVAQDATTPEYGYECESGFCIGAIPQLAAGYAPGTIPPNWTDDVGLILPQGADIAIQMHYAPSSIDQYDQTSVNLFFKDEPIERPIVVETIVDVQLSIPANEIYTHYKSINIDDEIGYDISLLSILPHMHLIGKSWLVYAENNGDTIPIISIPDWDFNWQNFYQPEYMLHIPKEYTIHAYATYDNTSNNTTNPNSPPQDMFWCDYTTCEMFFLPFSYVPYQEGDENIYLGSSQDFGCTDSTACNYDSEAIIDDGTCGVLDDCGVCHIPCCFNLTTSTCDYDVSEQDCQNYWADISVVSDPDQNIFWNISCVLGCMDPVACNYTLEVTVDDGSCEYPISDCLDCNGQFIDLNNNGIFDCDEVYGCTDTLACNYDTSANEDDGSCSYAQDYYDCDGICLNDQDGDGICDELECITVLCTEWSECILGDCICDNDVNENNICDEEEQEDCSYLSISSIYQSGNQIVVNVSNSTWDDIFPYPGFIVFNSLGDTLAIEYVNFYGIFEESSHVLELQQDVLITSDVSLQLFTGFYDFLQCEWLDLSIIDSCDLEPDPGECDAAIEVFFFDQSTLTCESTIWGGCNGLVPFFTLEECQESCESVSINQLISTRKVLKKVDILGRDYKSFNDGFFIELYDDGSVSKKIILDK